MKKIMTIAALTGVLAFGSAAGCEDPQPREYYPVDIPDCDKDDRSPHWDVKDCGPSPTAKAPSPRSVPRPSPRRIR